jgi:hypothetical protein
MILYFKKFTKWIYFQPQVSEWEIPGPVTEVTLTEPT